MTNIWTNPTRAYGGTTLKPEQQQMVWDAWTAHPALMQTHSLDAITHKAGVPLGAVSSLTDQMLQHARKAGIIRYVSGQGWELAP